MIDWTEEKLIEAGYTIRNAKITKVDLSTENHCAADFYMVLDGDGWGVCYGGYKLGHGGTYLKQNEIEGSDEGMAAILNIMWVVESDSLIGLKDKYVRVATKGWGDTVKIIGHITKDRWFDYGSFFSQKEVVK
jgi:hypothetical protein